MSADGSFSYVVDESNTLVQALRVTGQTVSEVFNYTMTDAGGLTSASTLTVTIDGRNDTPVAVADTASATEKGGVANGTAGSDPSGNVLTNDTDVDSGDTKVVKDITGANASVIAVTAGSTSLWSVDVERRWQLQLRC